MGAVNAIAAAGMLASANAPPPIMPAQRHAIMICPPGDASAKNNNGRVADKLPSNKELRIARLIVCAETFVGQTSGATLPKAVVKADDYDS